MKILFASDFHSQARDFEKFVEVLEKHFDVGVIAGDMMEDGIDKEETMQLLNLTEDDLIPNLPSADETYDEYMIREIENLHMKDSFFMRAMREKEKQFKSILKKTKKPILLVRGNHDVADWESEKNIYNMHGEIKEIKGFRFIGWEGKEYFGFDLKPFVNENTILITHYPPQIDNSPLQKLANSSFLREVIIERAPKMSLYGHMHSGGGKGYRAKNGTILLNGAMPRTHERKRGFISIDTNKTTITKIYF